MFQFAWKLSALDVPDAAAAWYLATVRAEAMEAVPRMMATTKKLKNSFIVSILSYTNMYYTNMVRCGIKISTAFSIDHYAAANRNERGPLCLLPMANTIGDDTVRFA
jgi:hypothetical protein